MTSPGETTPSSICAACGHDRVFHRIGTGNGVPLGKAYCDDRHASPCACTRFVARSETTMQSDDDEKTVTTTKGKLRTFERATVAAARAGLQVIRACDAFERAKEELERARAADTLAQDVAAAAARALHEEGRR